MIVVPQQWSSMAISGTMTAAISRDFRHEFERESLLHLRRRFLWYAGVVIGLNLLMGVLPIVLRAFFSLALGGGTGDASLLGSLRFGTLADFLILFGYTFSFLYVHPRLLGRARLVKLMTVLMVVGGLVRMVTGFLDYALPASGDAGEGAEFGLATFGTISLLGLVWTVLWTHVLACVFVPWTPREAMRPVLALSVGFACVCIAHLIRVNGVGWISVVGSLLLFPLVGLPGAALTLWNHDRFRESFLVRAIRGRYTQMKRELTDARRIHEALFPASQQRGSLRFDYCYEPMGQIGGDFVYARFVTIDDRRDPVLNLVLLDVTGHGIPAALTVNRLYGEVERLFAEDPTITPDRFLRALNRYVYLTLSDHSLFVTALAARIEPDGQNGRMLYASAGHPPAFLRAVDGTIEQLDSTAPVLGAFVDADYEIEALHRPFNAGDTFVGYTDGAIETRDAHGRMLGVQGLLHALASHRPADSATSSCGEIHPAGSFTRCIIDTVDRHRLGPPTDDTLVVEVACVFDFVTAKGPTAPSAFVSASTNAPGPLRSTAAP